MGEVLKKLMAETEEKKATTGMKFRLEENNGKQVLVLIDEKGNEVARHGLDANSDCSTCTYYCGQCVCNCPLIG